VVSKPIWWIRLKAAGPGHLSATNRRDDSPDGRPAFANIEADPEEVLRMTPREILDQLDRVIDGISREECPDWTSPGLVDT
jgi:hypothetical protein